MPLNINPEFEKNIFPISPDEFELLEQNILEEGIRDPLVIWDNNIIDGHNRYKIAMKHNLPFQTLEKDFDNDEEVKDWQDRNQLGRRNITPDQRKIIIGRRYNRERRKVGGNRGNQYKKEANHQNGNLPKFKSTAEKIGKESNVSQNTVLRYANRAKEFDKIKTDNPTLADDVWGGNKKLEEAIKEKGIAKDNETAVFDKEAFSAKFTAHGQLRKNRGGSKSKEERDREIKRFKEITDKIEIENELQLIAEKVNRGFSKEYRIYFLSLIKI